MSALDASPACAYFSAVELRATAMPPRVSACAASGLHAAPDLASRARRHRGMRESTNIAHIAFSASRSLATSLERSQRATAMAGSAIFGMGSRHASAHTLEERRNSSVAWIKWTLAVLMADRTAVRSIDANTKRCVFRGRYSTLSIRRIMLMKQGMSNVA
ncbi:hypothetical protein [Xanthomonas phaseoli]|nr:hypothetical protein [Xanthomonas phaseoli]MBO9916166.1 hypothetical protein [Xanthomonas phaseoli pv. dieffenbachiae]MBO9937648.1 hypothetical protein [Xanthomonas phaseoli pv. dieffenbachiae]